jgi:hypothetical protein
MSNSNTSFKTSEGNIDDEVTRIFKKNKGKNLYQIMEELKSKFKDEDFINSVLKKYETKLKRVKSIAEKIRDRLVSKYPSLSMSQYIEKITEYKKKYEFDDAEMQSIINLIFMKKDGLLGDAEYEPNLTEMSKALGFVPISNNMSGKLRVPQGEVEALEAIKGLSQATRELHNQVIIQSLIYQPLDSDLNSIALSKQFDKNKINLFNFVHPVIAALFFPKFQLLDEHMILAGIADIVYKKAEGIDLNTQPEYELYFDISTDPAETACTNKVKPFTDLLTRCNVQTKLWEAVLSLRQGKYYMSDLSSFILSIDQCKASVFDAADLAYVKDEGTILRKLFAAFSLRPTIVSTSPVYGISQNTANIAAVASTHITTVPMITLRIPMTWYREADPNADPIDLQQALEADQLYIHHRQLVVKRQQYLYSRNLLVFYIHRRYQMVNLARLSQPYTIASLPVTMSQFEQIMDQAIEIPATLPLVNQKFNLRSVVAVQTEETNTGTGAGGKIIIGCTTHVVVDNPKDVNTDYAWVYKPLNFKASGSEIEPMAIESQGDFVTETSTKGTLIIYQQLSAGGATGVLGTLN